MSPPPRPASFFLGDSDSRFRGRIRDLLLYALVLEQALEVEEIERGRARAGEGSAGDLAGLDDAVESCRCGIGAEMKTGGWVGSGVDGPSWLKGSDSVLCRSLVLRMRILFSGYSTLHVSRPITNKTNGTARSFIEHKNLEVLVQIFSFEVDFLTDPFFNDFTSFSLTLTYNQDDSQA